ncbi:DUF6397 family protein [Streptomyces sp. NPDC090108]|uniref:DUF6397 family protein n=1 Tax=Streptomyces sp. NPDC090108 TaxID=3365947 RepID=UPI003815B68D
MSGSTVTPHRTITARRTATPRRTVTPLHAVVPVPRDGPSGAGGPSRPVTCPPSRAARELGLRPNEFDLAVRLGRICTVPDEGGGGDRRVARSEIDRPRAASGSPTELRARVQVVGTAEGAAIMGVSAGRFARLARLGLLVPVRFYLNRYRAVVWLYLAEELRQFAAGEENARLLTGRTPETLRSQLASGVDLRARNWRGRHLGLLLRQAEGPWERAGALATFLASAEIEDIVGDPRERARLDGLRTSPPGAGAPGSPAACLAEELMTAQAPDEIDWLRADLAQVLEEARAQMRDRAVAAEPGRAVTADADRAGTADPGGVGAADADGTTSSNRSGTPGPPSMRRGLRGWLRRRGRRREDA